MKNKARELGLKEVTAINIINAKKFYKKNGFIDDGELLYIGDIG